MRLLNKKVWGLLLLWALNQGFAQGNKAGLKAWVEHSPVGLNQRFTLYVEMSGKGSQNVQPEVPSLNDWAAFLGSGSSQNMQIVNGAMSVSKTLHYQYQTLKEGSFTIPPIKAHINGKNYSVNPIKVTVSKTAGSATARRQPRQNRQGGSSADAIAAEDLFIRVHLNKSKVYVNEPVMLTYTIYTRVNVSSYEFSKVPATAGFWVEEIDQGQRPGTRTEVINGKRYTAATIKKTLLFPMSAGEKSIEPMVLRCTVRAQNRRRTVFDDFFNDSTVNQDISSKPVKISVIPLPAEGKPKGFSGQVGRFDVRATIDKQQVKTHEALTYRIIVSGEGNLRGLATPEPRFPEGFEVYPPEVKESLKRDGGTVSGNKSFEWLMVPRSAGRQVIPAFSLNYFDPLARKYRSAYTKEMVLQVARGAQGVTDNAPAQRLRQAVSLVGRDIRYIKTAPVALRRMATGFPMWLWGYFVLLPVFLILPAWLIRRHQSRLAGDVAFARGRRASRLAKRHLARAKTRLSVQTQKEFYAEVGQAVTGFIGDKLNMPTAGLMSEAVRAALAGKKVDTALIDSVMALLSQCDMMRFAPTASDESQMNDVYNQAEAVLNRLDRELSR